MDTISGDLCRELGYSAPIPRKNKPSVINTFMSIAFECAKRSPDAETQHGCVITSADHRLISTGYNGFPRNIDYSQLPNTRPHKYGWMRHAEKNALAWCPQRPVGCIAYITGKSCNDCLMTLWQHGITSIYEADRGITNESPTDEIERKLFLRLAHPHGLRMHKVPLPSAILR